MRQILRKGVTGVSLFHLFTLSLLLLACSSDNEIEGEYDNWQEKNDQMTDTWASKANNGGFRKILTYSKNEGATALKNSDYIYVEVLESGSETESPLFTDTVRVAYRGHLIPTKTYADGYVFEQTYIGDFSWKTARFEDMTAQILTLGFATAVMNMHKGDYWRIHVPYQLGYGSASAGNILAYSDLVFEIALLDFWPIGDSRPAFKARGKSE